MSESISEVSFDFDLAVSFAVEDREYVEEFVEKLKAAGLRVFYDSDYQSEMWGEDLVEFFDKVYRLQSKYAVLFLSHWYAQKMWTRQERRSALARALTERAAYVLPIRLDDADVEGIRPTTGYIDARRVGLEGLVAATLAKVSGRANVAASAMDWVPRSEAGRQLLLVERPPAWEYRYFAGCLLAGRASIDDKYQDHLLRYAVPTGKAVSIQQTWQFVADASSEVLLIIDNFNRVLSTEAQTRAFGPPGMSGDPNAIAHLAKRWNSVYESFMTWAAGIRGVAVPRQAGKLLDLLAQHVDNAIEQYRTFVSDFTEQVERLVEQIMAGNPMHIDMTLKVSIPEGVHTAFLAELSQLPRT